MNENIKAISALSEAIKKIGITLDEAKVNLKQAFKVLDGLKICSQCKNTLATTTYGGLPVCEHCCKMLDDEFDREMS